MIKGFKPLIITLTVSALLFSGCSSSKNSDSKNGSVDNSSKSDSTPEIYTSTSSSSVVVDTTFSARDLEVGYEQSTSTKITLSDSGIKVSGNGTSVTGSVLTINEEGTYLISGTLTNGQIVVDAKDTDKIHIILNGASITCETHSPIYIKTADKVFMTIEKDTVNTLTDGKEYVQIDDNTADGVVFSKADLTINGTGTLNINGNYKHGILSKDDLNITGGIFNINTVKDALNGKDCVKIKDGTFNISSKTGNGIQSKNGDDTTRGYVYICGGTINVLASEEGIEGTVILISGGEVNITSIDDGLNSAKGKASTNEDSTQVTTQGKIDKGGQGGGNGADADCYISITGGTLNIDASGDGIDSNGSLYISGGLITVSGPTNSGNGGLDYNGVAEISGGTLIVVGSTGMAQGLSNTSTQYSILNNLTSPCEGGTEVVLTDKDGKVIVSYTPKKSYQSVVISSPDLEKDSTYTLTCGSQNAELTLSSIVTSNGQQGGMQGGRPGMQGERPDMQGERPEMPSERPNADGEQGMELPPDMVIPNAEDTSNSL